MEKEKFLDVLNRELVIAIGCTEPIAIAIAASLARKYVLGNIINIEVCASRNVVKNAMSVKIPGTKTSGINIAAALGTLIGGLDKNLELMDNLTDKDMENADKMIKKGMVTVTLADVPKKLYIEVIIETNISNSRVVIEDIHNNVVFIEVDGIPLKEFQGDIDIPSINKLKEEDQNFLNLDSIIEFIGKVDILELDLIRKTIEINMKICLDGLNRSYGLSVGKSMKSQIEKGLFADDVYNYATALTAAGSDARMGGSNLPVMSNSGSGNQGIAATIPVVAFGKGLKKDEDKIVRAVTLSNLMTIYIKSKLGRLSAFCGATISAIGVSCGITYLMGGNESEIRSSLQNITGNITGIICDGAKAGCALKVATCTSAAIQSAVVTAEGNTIKSTDGIIENNPEKTIENFCRVGNVGMEEADRIILDIMLKKSNCPFSIKT